MKNISPLRLAFGLVFALTACGDALEYWAPSGSAPLDELPPTHAEEGGVATHDATASSIVADATSDASVPDVVTPADGSAPKVCAVRPPITPPGPRLVSRQVTGSGACAPTTLGQAIDAVYALFPSFADITYLHDPSQLTVGDGSRIHAFATPSGGFAIVIYRGSGDCPAGCTDNEYWYFETDASCTVKQIGQFHPMYTSSPGGGCLSIVGAPMWATPLPYPATSFCNADNAARDISGTHALCTNGYSGTCAFPATAQKAFSGDLQLVIAQTADLSKGTVTITGTGNALVDGVALDATFTRRRLQARKSVSNLPAKCLAEHTIDLDLDLDGDAPGKLLVHEARSAPDCADGGSYIPYCKASTTIQLYPPVTPATTAVCSPGVHQCIGNVSQTCDATGHWGGGPTCPIACIEGVCAECVPGTKDCLGNVPRTCDAMGHWQPLAPCTHACGGGVCGSACTGDCTCVDGVCPPAAIASNAARYVVDADDVYWTPSSPAWLNPNPATSGSLQKAPLTGGPPSVLAQMERFGLEIAVDASHVYWAEASFNTQGTVKRVPLDGGAPATLATSPRPYGLSVDASGVYWTSSLGFTKSPLEGGTATTVGPPIGPFALDAANVYWANGGGDIFKMPRDGGTPVRIATGQSYSSTVVVDATRVYWTSAPSVRAAPIGGGPVETLATNRTDAQWIAVDATNVYWAENAYSSFDGAVMTMPLTGGTPTMLAARQFQPSRVTVNGTHVFWMTGSTVMSVAK